MSFNHGNHVWWNGCYQPSRQGATQIDHYFIHDRDQTSAGQRVVDSRCRSLESRDPSKNIIFGPEKSDLRYGRKKLKPARGAGQSHGEMCFKLDPYGAKAAQSQSSFGTSSRSLEFSRNPGDRFHLSKPVGKDFTKIGWRTNTIKPDGMPSAFRRSASMSLLQRTF